ncbi:MAG: S8 family serine peptidase [Candidatus Nitrosocaldaceae archaeon]
MNNIYAILLLMLLLAPQFSLAYINDLNHLESSPTIQSEYKIRESLLIDIEDLKYTQLVRAIDLSSMHPIAIKENDILSMQDRKIIRDQPLDFMNRDASRVAEIIGSARIASEGFTGKDVKIAIVDSGTDFSNEDMRDALARDDNNIPIIFDADAQGIVLTTTRFIAKYDGNKIINNTDFKTDDDFTSDVYVNSDGVFLHAKTNNTKFQIYNPLYPYLSPLIFNATTSNDWKIGKSDEDFIRSASGIYRMGFAVEIQYHLGRFGLIIVPILVVDNKEPNLYDTIIVDMSDTWADFAMFELGKVQTFDFDFSDEIVRRIGDGNELLIYDADSDNRTDITAGILGARVVDLWGAINAPATFDYLGLNNATVLEPIDRDGRYVGIMYDFFGHGTATASTIVSKGINTYDIYKNGTQYKIDGIAKDAKIIPVKALWAGDTQYAWMLAAGFDLINGTWKYSEKRADIINNSWGIPVITLLEYAPLYDPIAILADTLSVPSSLDANYKGVLFVSSAGNSGYGHGTISSPAASMLSLSVGASTNNVFVGYGFTKNEPRFGNSTKYHNDIAEFSSRGPLVNGYVKPEIVAPGAYGFVPMLVNVKHVESEPVSLFGGTSMSAPIISGAAAILIEAFRERGIEPTPQLIKNLLISSASTLSNEPFTQGSGIVNLTNAIDYIKGMTGTFLVYTNITHKINDLYRAYNTNIEVESSNLYAGYVEKNKSKDFVFYIHNPSNRILLADIKGERLELIKRITLNGSTIVRELDPLLNNTGGFIPNYVRINTSEIPKDTELLYIKLRFPFETFMNMSDIYAHYLKISSLYLYNWDDVNNDSKVWFNETSMINRGGAYGTVQELTVHDPLNKIKNNMLIGIYPVPNIVSFWTGVRDINSTSMNYTLTIDFYKKAKWDVIKPNISTLLIKPNSTSKFMVKIDTKDLAYGIHQGYLTIMSNKMSSNIPVSFAIPLSLTDKDIPYVILNNSSNTLFYETSSLVGAFDMSSRFNSGEWRFYHLNVTDPSINTISGKVIWQNNFTSMHVFALDPDGKIVTSSVPAGVFKTFINWGSNDWLGNGILGSGAFYPAAHVGNNTITFYIPVNKTGIYTIMLHNTLFHANNLTEQFSVEMKASTILADMDKPVIIFDMSRYTKDIINIPVSVNDANIQYIKYRIDGIEEDLKGNEIILDTNRLDDGKHIIEVYARDTVGNVLQVSKEFIVDNTQPEIIIDIPKRIYSKTVDVRFDILEPNLANFTVLLPNGTLVNTQEFALDTTSLKDGEHEITIIAEDLAGNNSTLSTSISVDNTPPSVSIDISSTQNLLGIIEIVYNVTDPNLKNKRIVIDDLSMELNQTDNIYRLDTTSLKDGEHEITIIAEDLADNSASKSIKISSINQLVMRDNARNTGIFIGIGIGAAVLASIMIPLYIKKRL